MISTDKSFFLFLRQKSGNLRQIQSDDALFLGISTYAAVFGTGQ